METNNIYYVYQIIDPRTKSVIYIGKGKNKRYLVHEKRVINKGRSINLKLENKLRKIISMGMLPIYSFVQKNLKEDDAYKLEQQLTLQIGLPLLCNLKYGGTNNAVFTEDVKKRMREAAKLKDKSVYTNPERCRKISLAKIGVPRSEATKKKISDSLKGKSFVDRFGQIRAIEIGRKISIANTGKKKPKQSIAMKGRFIGEKNPMFGKFHSEEFKQKRRDYFNSDKNPGKNKTEETKRKISASKVGKPGHKHSEEHKQKMSILMKDIWKERKYAAQ